MYYRTADDLENQSPFDSLSSRFSSIDGRSNKVRNAFIKKVYSLLSLQLLVTTMVALPFVTTDPEVLLPWISRNVWLVWTSLAASVGIMLTFACIPQLMYQVPINYFLLALFTLTEGFCVGFISAMYTTESVVLAFGIVTVVTFALTVFALTTDMDFTKSGPYLLAATVVMIVAGFILIFVPSRTGILVYSSLGALLFSVYLVFDTQMIIGGKRATFQFSIDDYVPAAIALYLDIIQLFIYFLQIFGQRRD